MKQSPNNHETGTAALVQQGQRHELGALRLKHELVVGAEIRPGLDIDFCIFGTSPRKKLKNDAYFVFYNQKQSPNGEITLLSDNKTFAVQLDALPETIGRLIFCLTSDSGLEHREDLSLRFSGADAEPTVAIQFEADLSHDQSLVVCELYRHQEQWWLNTSPELFSGGLKDLLEYFGGKVEDPAPESPTSPQVPLSVEAPPPLSIKHLNDRDAEVANKIADLTRRIPKALDLLQTEEATKHALVMPFIQALGYDVFDPNEVVPELTADTGIKKGEKVDYAIMHGGRAAILIECKHHTENPSAEHASQLYRYFSVTEARFAVLTNGIVYRLFTDLERPNIMDPQPFFEFNLLQLKQSDLAELLKYAKHAFDQDLILGSANEIKYINAIKAHLFAEFTEPSDDFIRLLTARVFDGRLTASVRGRFAVYTKKALSEVVAQLMSDRLREAFQAAPPAVAAKDEPDEQEVDEQGLITTPEEWQGFYIVRSILRDNINYARLYIRKNQSYCSVLLDNNRRKTVCRLYFTEKRLTVGLFDSSDRQEVRTVIKTLDDLFKFAARLQKTVQQLELRA